MMRTLTTMITSIPSVSLSYCDPINMRMTPGKKDLLQLVVIDLTSKCVCVGTETVRVWIFNKTSTEIHADEGEVLK